MDNNKEKKVNPAVQAVLEKRKPEKISIKDFVAKYESLSTDQEKKRYISSTVKIKKYIEYAMKVTIAKQIINQSCFDEKGNIKVDSPHKYFLYIISIFSMYTNLDFDEKESSIDYDLLARNGLIATVLSLIPEEELSEYRTIVQMTYDDCITNNYEIHSIINKKLTEFWPSVSGNINYLLDTLSKKIKGLDSKEMEELFKGVLK